MILTFETLEAAAKQLSVKERAALAHTLLKSLDEGEDDDAEELWAAEIHRRADLYKRGEMETVDLDEAMARIRSRLK